MTTEADTPDEPHPWSRRRQEVGIIVWASFLAACLASLVFFAIFDPLLLGRDDQPPAWLVSRMTGYALGFFFFWVITTVAALLTAYLLETLPIDSQEGESQEENGAANEPKP